MLDAGAQQLTSFRSSSSFLSSQQKMRHTSCHQRLSTNHSSRWYFSTYFSSNALFKKPFTKRCCLLCDSAHAIFWGLWCVPYFARSIISLSYKFTNFTHSVNFAIIFTNFNNLSFPTCWKYIGQLVWFLSFCLYIFFRRRTFRIMRGCSWKVRIFSVLYFLDMGQQMPCYTWHLTREGS